MVTKRKSKDKTVQSPLAAQTPPAGSGAGANAGADAASAAAGFPVVGIGASAGGLAALEVFFSSMPVDIDPGMAFVLVQHLAPDHKSILTEIIQRYTRMQVFEVEDGMVVQPNCTYIIPPNRDMAFLNGTLQLLEPSEPRGQRLPIDFFFRSLASDRHERAICVVLSGTGSDGTLGLRAIKGEGGMAMVQSPDTTEFDGMPSSAIATGMVDYELAPAEMPAQLIAYATHAFGPLTRQALVAAPRTESALKKIFTLLRAKVGHDFSQYKPNTIQRRIERRMAVHQVEAIDAYVKFLQQTPAELEALFRDLLIGVTNFFRDPSAFLALEQQAIPDIFKGKPAGEAVRVWCTGCSTGEEAYSIAMLLQERMEALRQTYQVQVFATDIDSRAIATARAGVYPASIASDISPERLARFFSPEADGSVYRIHKGIRDMLVFSEQDLIQDPPFSRLDLISCRNLLIYMGGALQKKLIPLFHYTLNPGGVLFLGTSETVGEFSDLFAVVDLKAKLFKRKQGFDGAPRLAHGRFLPPLTVADATPPQVAGKPSRAGRLSLRELTEQALLTQIDLAGVLVTGQGDILYLHGRTGMYLEPAPGEVRINNILKMAREGLRRELATALHKAAGTGERVNSHGLRVKTNGHFSTVNLAVRPVTGGTSETLETPLYLVVLEQAPIQNPSGGPATNHEPDDTTGRGAPLNDGAFDKVSASATIAALNDELRANEEYLQAANEELETSNEELKSSNEEMQSVNEELQSTNEELETSKEEMQSINEELSTVNAELQAKVVDLSRASNDMNNLMSSTGIGTVFVDHQLRIMRFTPAATQIINLIPSDMGRPVAHTVSNLVSYTDLVADAKGVLDTLVPKEVEVQTYEGAWYKMRIQPYRTLDNVIEGAVITFVDITESVRTRDALHKANELLRLAVVVRDAFDAITVQDLNGRILAWNPGATRMYGWSEAEALAMNVRDRIPQGLREKELVKVHQLSQEEVLEPYRTRRIAKNGAVMEVSMTCTALVNETGLMYAIATTERAWVPRPGQNTGAHNGPNE